MSIKIIAEAGVNHNGDLELARRLVDAAAEAGADYVKFQTFRAENLASASARKAEYQEATTGAGESQLEMLRRLELPPAAHRELKHRCAERGVTFLSTPFDLGSIDFLEGLGMPFWKIPSGEITNYPYLRRIAETGLEVVLSTGMSDLEEIEAALDALYRHHCGKVTLLHCNTEYPTPFADVNLRAMRTMRDRFGVDVGYSDHTPGIEAACAAAALGAAVIEKHFTLDQSLPGPDHKASLEPAELEALVRSIRNIEAALGDGVKRPSPSERGNIPIVRKSIVAARAIRAGERLTDDNLAAKRPAGGLSPMLWEKVAGTAAARDFAKDEMITL